jgi:hypothetical protein
LLSVDKQMLSVDWAKTQLESTSIFKSWTYIYKEMEDIGVSYVGYKAKATFRPINVPNRTEVARTDQ